MIYPDTQQNVGYMTCSMLVAVHRTSDISFSNNHSTYVHLSTLSPSLIALIRLRLVKDASKSRTVDYLKRVYVYTYKTENFIQNFIIYYSFKFYINCIGDIYHRMQRRLVKEEWKKMKRRRLTVGPLPPIILSKGEKRSRCTDGQQKRKQEYIYIYIKETGREEAAFSMKALK